MLDHSYVVNTLSIGEKKFVAPDIRPLLMVGVREPTKEELEVIGEQLKAIYGHFGLDLDGDTFAVSKINPLRCEGCSYRVERDDYAREGLTGYCAMHDEYVRSDGYCDKGAWHVKELFIDE